MAAIFFWFKGEKYAKSRNLLFFGIELTYEVEVQSRAHPDGINGKRITKLMIRRGTQILANYDHGWRLRVRGALAIEVLKFVLKRYN
jgi:hypothetical protein